jgi:hypothetical protein
LKRHRSISTGWEQPVDKEPAHRYVDSTARGGFGLTVQETSGGARETGSAPPSPECDLAVEGTSGAAERALLRGRAREAALQAGRPARAGRSGGGLRESKLAGKRGVLVTSRVPGRHVKGAPGWVGPARVASPATRVTRIATTRCTSRCGLGSPRLSRPASAERARRRPGKRERNRAPDSWSLGWSVPQGASPPGHGELRGQPPARPPLHGGEE